MQIEKIAERTGKTDREAGNEMDNKTNNRIDNKTDNKADKKTDNRTGGIRVEKQAADILVRGIGGLRLLALC